MWHTEQTYQAGERAGKLHLEPNIGRQSLLDLPMNLRAEVKVQSSGQVQNLDTLSCGCRMKPTLHEATKLHIFRGRCYDCSDILGGIFVT